MVLMPQPIFDCIRSIKTDDSLVIMLTPEGKTYKQEMALKLRNYKHLILLCGHYEGFDERIKTICDMFISVGDFILTGGEIPSMLITDSIVRLLDGVIDKESLESESFNSKLLDYPTYTKPRDFEGMLVPDVLLSGDHKKIAEYRKNEQIKKTKDEIKELTVSYSDKLEEEENLKEEITRLQDPEYMAKYAREKYLYSKDNEIILKIEE